VEPFVVIIILNWNNADDTIKCLKSLREIRYSDYCIFLIDNNSEDDSLEKIGNYLSNSDYFNFAGLKEQNFEYTNVEIDSGLSQEQIIQIKSQKLITIKNNCNFGFAEGNNIGIRLAIHSISPDYILLLNNDTIVTPDFLTNLVNVAENDLQVGIVSPKLLRMSNPEIIDSTGHIFKYGFISDRGFGEQDNHQYDNKLEIIGAIGAAALYRSEMIRKIGLLDSNYFVSYEDAEYSWRAYKAGWKGKFVPGAIVYHKRGGTIDRDSDIKKNITTMNLKNLSRCIKKHATQAQKLEATWFFIKGGMKSMIRNLLGHKDIDFRVSQEMLVDLYLRK
jgi:GT2 family glycosyltransferase